MPDSLNEYIKKNLIQGVQKSTIEANLIQVGWTKEKIDETLNKISLEKKLSSFSIKRILKFLAFGFVSVVLLGYLVVVVSFILLPVTSRLPSNKIESPKNVYMEDNMLYITDGGKTESGFGRLRPAMIWVYELPSGKFLSSYVSGTEEYQKLFKKITKEYTNANRWKSMPSPNGRVYGATSSATKKRYIESSRIVEGKGTVYYIEVFSPENKKIKEIPYNTELLFSSPSGFIYFTDNESKSVFMYKLDSNTDEVILKKKFPIKKQTIGMLVDYSPFITDEEVYLLPRVLGTVKLRTDILIYDLAKDEFLPKINLEGIYHGVFVKGKDIFLAGRDDVIWVDKDTGKVVKRFTGK